MTACFWMELAGDSVVTLRRYAGDKECASRWGYHNVSSGEIDRVPTVIDAEHIDVTRSTLAEPPHDDPRWPTVCTCGYTFVDDDEWQINADRLYRRGDTGDLTSLRDAAPGAMWDAAWMPDRLKGQDGRCIIVRLPNGHDWTVDGEATNCTRKGEDHDCWCRHGDPPNLTVDKNPEPGRTTCQAGAGSIASGKGDDHWHGFLRGGQLVT